MRQKFDLRCLPNRPDLTLEFDLWAQGCIRVAGIDEAGRGAWAGPVAAAAVILPPDQDIYDVLTGVRDSKQMTPGQRTEWAAIIQSRVFAWAVGTASHTEIDQIGIVPATRLAVTRALERLGVTPQHLLVDYLPLPEVPLSQTLLVKGDARSLSIAAASVLAKTSRDALLCQADETYPQYGFARHKGYGTAFHQAMIQRYGPCPIHRMSFTPLKAFLSPENRTEANQNMINP